MKVAGCNVSGFQNGPTKLAKFDFPWGIALNPNNNCLYISDTGSNCIRMINNGSMVMKFNMAYLLCNISIFLDVSTFAGKPGTAGFANSQGINARFNRPFQLVYSNKENCFFVADMGNNVIRKITMDGMALCKKSKIL